MCKVHFCSLPTINVLSRTTRHHRHAHVRACCCRVGDTVISGAITTHRHHSFCTLPIISSRKCNSDFTNTELKVRINIRIPFYKSAQYVNTSQTFLVHHGRKIYFHGWYIGERFIPLMCSLLDTSRSITLKKSHDTYYLLFIRES